MCSVTVTNSQNEIDANSCTVASNVQAKSFVEGLKTSKGNVWSSQELCPYRRHDCKVCCLDSIDCTATHSR